MDDLKDFKIREDHDCYTEDCDRIAAVVRAHGYNCNRYQAKLLWEKYSESMAAGWMCLPEDDRDLYCCVSYYIVEEETDGLR